MSGSYWMRPLGLAQEWVSRVVRPGDCVVDATMGNGHDTLFLARTVGQGGVVYGFDIQPVAQENTRVRLEEAGVYGGHVHLYVDSHVRMGDYVEAPVMAVMFNLGYLPGGDKAIISEAHETLRALDSALVMLAVGGILTVMCYPGHDGGDVETAAVCTWARALSPSRWRVARVEHFNAETRAPLLIAVIRRA